MKKIITIIAITIMTITVSATEKADTIKADNTKITKIIVDSTTNSKGNPTIKYYIIYDNELINTSKTVVDKFKLAQKYGTKQSLAIVKKGNNRRIILY